MYVRAFVQYEILFADFNKKEPFLLLRANYHKASIDETFLVIHDMKQSFEKHYVMRLSVKLTALLAAAATYRQLDTQM